LSKVVEKAAKLTVLNTRGSAFKVRSSGKKYQQIKQVEQICLKLALRLLKIK
jgi:hypothetical protein